MYVLLLVSVAVCVWPYVCFLSYFEGKNSVPGLLLFSLERTALTIACVFKRKLYLTDEKQKKKNKKIKFLIK